MNGKILVTGGCGYIGSTLVPELLKKGYSVTVLDNLMFNEPSLNHVCHHEKLTLINGDVRNRHDIEPLLKKSDIIIPLAAYVGAPLCDKDPSGADSVNKEAIKMMLEIISNEQRIIMPTTNSAYGSGNDENYCDESSELKPISKYAIDKVEVEKDLMQRENSISLRLATVFGVSPRMRLDLLVNDFTYRAFTDRFLVLFESQFKRNYIHVRDVSLAFNHCIKNFETMNGEIYNVGLSNANLSKWELCMKIKKFVPNFYFTEAEIGEDKDKRNYIVSNKKIQQTGYCPEKTIEDGIVELLKGFEMIKNSRFGNV